MLKVTVDVLPNRTPYHRQSLLHWRFMCTYKMDGIFHDWFVDHLNTYQIIISHKDPDEPGWHISAKTLGIVPRTIWRNDIRKIFAKIGVEYQEEQTGKTGVVHFHEKGV